MAQPGQQGHSQDQDRSCCHPQLLWHRDGLSLGAPCPSLPIPAHPQLEELLLPPVPSPAPAIDFIILSCTAGKLSLDPRGQGRLKAMGEAKLGAQLTLDPMDLLSTAHGLCWKTLTPNWSTEPGPGVCFGFSALKAFSKLWLGSNCEPYLPILGLSGVPQMLLQTAAGCEWQGSVCCSCQEYFSSGFICIIILNPFYRAHIDLQGLLAF